MKVVRLFVALALAFWPLEALAAATTFTGKNASGTTITFDATEDASDNLAAWQVICDYSALANCAQVDSSHNLGVVVGEALPAGSNTIGSIGNAGFNALQGGSANAVGNPFYVSPGTSAVWAASQSGTWTVEPGNTANTTAWLFNLGSMGGTAINSECVGALSGFSTTIPSTVCGVFGVYALNTNGNGAAAASSSSPVTDANIPVGSASLAATQVSVADTATSILSARTGVSGTGRVCADIENTSTTAVYIGGSGVTTSTGMLLPGILGADLHICTTAAIYGIVASGTETVSALETY